MIKWIIHTVVPEHHRAKTTHRIISGLLVRFLLLGLLGCILYGALYYSAGSDILVVTAFMTAFLFLFLLLAFRFVPRTRYISYGFIFALYFAYTTQIYFTGGASSPVMSHLVLLPLISLLPGIRKDWFVLLGITLATILIFMAMEIGFNYEFPRELIGIHSLIFNSVGAAFPYVALVTFIPMFMRNVTRSNDALKEAYIKLKNTGKRLVETEKLASLGQLTAGIAHEINNPVNYTLGSAQRLKEDVEDLVQYESFRNKLWQDIEVALQQGNIEDKRNIIRSVVEQNAGRKAEIQYDELLEELGELLASVEHGAERTAEIVKGLRTFSRLDDSEFKLVNITEYIDSTLVILESKMKGRIELKKKYMELPPVECNPSKINQVLLNIVSNAIQAIEDEGFVKITASYNIGLQQVTIKVEDSGKGIPKSIESEIFNPFFTTKDVGEGTGLGLAMCKGIIEEHHGRLFFRSLPGVGTTFFIELPVAQPKGLESNAKKEDRTSWADELGRVIN